jgi:two-component system response regulator PilR (NtrC family)
MSQPLALVIDDEPDICELLSLTLGRMDIRTETAVNVTSAKALLVSTQFDLCLTDMRLPDGDGLELVEWMQTNAADVPVAVITAHGNVETAVQALKLGAFDFISKPLDLSNLRNIVENALKIERAAKEQASQLIGDSAPMRDLREMVDKVARSQAPVHISGESGTGKELVARLIHDSGPRAESSSATVKAVSPAPSATRSGWCRVPTAARCSSTKLPICRWQCRSNCCGLSRRRRYAP